MSIRVVVPELLKKARGVRTMDAIVTASNKAFTKASLSKWESGKQRPTDDSKIVLCEALGVKYEKISMPIDQVPSDSKFFAKNVNRRLTNI